METMGRDGETVRAVKARREYVFIETASGIHILESDGLKLIAAEDDIQAWEFGNSELFIATSKGYYSLADSNWSSLRPLQTRVPVAPMTSLVFHNGRLWAGTAHGVSSTDNHDHYRYWSGGRWLIEDEVIELDLNYHEVYYAL